jgi:hypothetical protein
MSEEVSTMKRNRFSMWECFGSGFSARPGVAATSTAAIRTQSQRQERNRARTISGQ